MSGQTDEQRSIDAQTGFWCGALVTAAGSFIDLAGRWHLGVTGFGLIALSQLYLRAREGDPVAVRTFRFGLAGAFAFVVLNVVTGILYRDAGGS